MPGGRVLHFVSVKTTLFALFKKKGNCNRDNSLEAGDAHLERERKEQMQNAKQMLTPFLVFQCWQRL
jgi:hypothetical protein